MTGIIKSYIEDKQFGFIKGDDKKDYFFHRSSVNNKDSIVDGAIVSFDTKATPKGYTATKIKIEKLSSLKYNVPDTIYTSREKKVKGWEIIENSNWNIYSSSESSADDARAIALQNAAAIGANALIGFEYYKETQSRVSDSGRGVYHYSVHNFKGRAVNIGKKSGTGKYTKEDLMRIERLAPKIKKELIEKTNSSKNTVRTYWIISAIFLGLGAVAAMIGKEPGFLLPGAGAIGIGLLFVRHEDYDWWLSNGKS